MSSIQVFYENVLSDPIPASLSSELEFGIIRPVLTYRPMGIHSNNCYPIKYGEYAEIYEICATPPSTLAAAVKIFRENPAPSAKIKFSSVLAVAADQPHADHNIIYTSRPRDFPSTGPPSFITPLFRKGNILEYAKKQPGTRVLPLIIQAAQALARIHSQDEVHGNVNPNNILISEEERAYISDAGFNMKLRACDDDENHPIPNNWMYKAPEELVPHDGETLKYTPHMDTYTFASTIFAVFTLRPPFNPINYGRGIVSICEKGHGGTLKQPTAISQPLWDFLQRCWSYEPSTRPSMTSAVLELQQLAGL